MAKKKALRPVAKRSGKAKLVRSKLQYKGPIFSVWTDEVREPSGVTVRRDVVRHDGSVVVIALDESGREPKLLLERQYRHAAGQFLWEIPAGRVDPGEARLAAAKRELLEETGFTARKWKLAVRIWASPGFVAETMDLFLARGLKAGQAQPEHDEDIEFHLLPLSEVRKMIRGGKIQDAKTIVAVLWILERLMPSKKRVGTNN